MIWNKNHARERHRHYFKMVPVVPGKGTMQHDPQHPITLQSRIVNIFNVIYTHLTTPTIRSEIEWLRTSYMVKSKYICNNQMRLWDAVLKYKFSRDTFCFHNGRQCTLTVLTCTSIHGGTTSLLLSDVIGIYDGTETRHSLSLMSQQHDTQIFILRALGIADPNCGEVIGIELTNVEDSGGWVKSVGRDKATSSTRWCFSRHNHHIHTILWKKYQVALTIPFTERQSPSFFDYPCTRSPFALMNTIIMVSIVKITKCGQDGAMIHGNAMIAMGKDQTTTFLSKLNCIFEELLSGNAIGIHRLMTLWLEHNTTNMIIIF